MVTTGVVRPAEAGAESEVSEFDVSAAVDEHIVWFNISMYEAHSVDTVDSQDQLCHNELRQSLIKDTQPDQQTHQVATRDVLHYEVQMRRVLQPAIKPVSKANSTLHLFVVCT